MSRTETRKREASPLFAERLQEAQAGRELKNADAAAELGVGLRLYQMWRSGMLPNLPNLLRLAAFYEVSVGWLLGEDEA